MATKRPRRTFQQILDNVAAIRRFTAGLDERTFKENELVVAAVERLSEPYQRGRYAPGRRGSGRRAQPPLGPDTEDRQPPSACIDTVNLDTIWEIVTLDLDALELACKRALATLPPDP